MKIFLIVACARNGLIGAAGKLPWHLPADLKRFKTITLGKTLLMGRKTWASLPVQPLPGRRNIVLSRNPQFHTPHAECIHTVDELFQCLGEEEVCFVTGGAEVYAHFLPHAARIYLTLVDTEIEGDVYFPLPALADWTIVSRTRHGQDADNALSMEFLILEKSVGSGKPGDVTLAGNAESFFRP